MTRRVPAAALDPLVVFPSLWLLGVVLARLDPFGSDVWDWSGATWGVMVAAPAAFLAGGLLGRRIAAARRASRPPAPPSDHLADPRARAAVRTALVTCLVLGFLELGHQFAAAGSVPLLSGNIDAARAAQPAGPTVVLIDLLTAALVAALALPARLASRAALPELAVAVAAATGFALAGGRGTVVLALVAAVLARALLHGAPRVWVLLLAATVALVGVSAVFFVRAGQHRDAPFEARLYEEILPGLAPPERAYVPLHYGLATNFDVLAAVVDHFPAAEPYGRGKYSMSGFDLVVPGTRPLGSVTTELTSPFVTSTMAGPFWADGGLVAVVLGLAAVGAVACAAYSLARASRAPPTCLVAGHLGMMAIFGVYSNLFTDHPDWVVILPALAGLGWLSTARESRARALPEPPAGVVDFATRYARALPAGIYAAIRRDARRPSIRPSAPRMRPSVLRWPLGLLAVVVAAAVAFEIARDPAETPEVPPPLQAGETFELPRAAVSEAAALATDGDLRADNASLWALRRRGRAIDARRLSFETGVPEQHRVTVRVGPAGRDERLDVTEWPTGDAVVALTLRSHGVGVRVFDAARPRRVESTGFARIRAPSVRRDVAMASWDPPAPDLFVIDRGGPRERVRVTVWRGEEGFAARAADLRAPLRGLDADDWTFDVARLTGPRPDLVAWARAGTASKLPEAHVLSGSSGYTRFVLQRPVDVGSASRAAEVLAGTTLGQPSLLLVSGARLVSVPVAPPRPGGAP